MPGFPRDPLISRYPAPLTAAEARKEVRRAAQLRRRVPLAHPYGLAPLWTPYAVARLVSRLVERRHPTPPAKPIAALRPLIVELAPTPKPPPRKRRKTRDEFARRWAESTEA